MTIRLLSLLLLPTLVSAQETITLNPTQDSDAYQFVGFPTGTTFSLGVNPSGGGGHTQKSLVQFDVSESSLGFGADKVASATLRFYVLPPTAEFESFTAGDLDVLFQTQNWSVSTLRFSTIAPGEKITTFNVPETEVFVEADVTSAVREWLEGRDNFGFVVQNPDEFSGASTSLGATEAGENLQPALIIERGSATVDADGDGYRDSDEIANRSDPNDASDIPVQPVFTADSMLTFRAWAGRRYRVFYAETLGVTPQPISAPINGDGAMTAFDIENDLAAGASLSPDGGFFFVGDVTE